MSAIMTLDRDDVAALLPVVTRTWDAHRNRHVANGTLLHGPAGTGKSSLAQAMAEQLGLPAYKVQCTPSADQSAIYGTAYPGKSGVWEHFYGPAMLAWGATGKPGVLVLDDIHNAGADIISALYAVLDSGAGGMVTSPQGETLTPSQEFRVIATMNGDPEDLFAAYEGFKDRLRVRIPVMQPSTEMIETLDERVQAGVLADYDGTNKYPVATFRQWQTMSTLWPLVGVEKACLLSLGDEQKALKMLEALAMVDDTQEATRAYNAVISRMSSGSK